MGRPGLSGRQKAAKGIGGGRQARRGRHPEAERRGTREAERHRVQPKAQTVPPAGG